MRIDEYKFGKISIDGQTYHHDIVIDWGQVRPRDSNPSNRFRWKYGHIPLSAKEYLPWDCKKLLIGTGSNGSMQITQEVYDEAAKKGVRISAMTTPELVDLINKHGLPEENNAIIHLTC